MILENLRLLPGSIFPFSRAFWSSQFLWCVLKNYQSLITEKLFEQSPKMKYQDSWFRNRHKLSLSKNLIVRGTKTVWKDQAFEWVRSAVIGPEAGKWPVFWVNGGMKGLSDIKYFRHWNSFIGPRPSILDLITQSLWVKGLWFSSRRNLGLEFNLEHGFQLSDRKIRLIYTFYVPKMRLVLGTRELNVLWNWKIFGFFIRRKILRPLIRSRVKSSSFNDISMNGISRFMKVIWGQTIRRSRERIDVIKTEIMNDQEWVIFRWTPVGHVINIRSIILTAGCVGQLTQQGSFKVIWGLTSSA